MESVSRRYCCEKKTKRGMNKRKRTRKGKRKNRKIEKRVFHYFIILKNIPMGAFSSPYFLELVIIN